MILVNLVSKTGRTFQWRCGVLFGTYSFRIKGANQPDLYVWDPKLKTPQDDQQKCEKLWPAIMVHGRGSAFWFGKMAREKKALPWSACSKAYLVGSWATPLKNVRYISQLGSLFPIYGKIKNVPNHQPDYIFMGTSSTTGQLSSKPWEHVFFLEAIHGPWGHWYWTGSCWYRTGSVWYI